MQSHQLRGNQFSHRGTDSPRLNTTFQNNDNYQTYPNVNQRADIIPTDGVTLRNPNIRLVLSIISSKPPLWLRVLFIALLVFVFTNTVIGITFWAISKTPQNQIFDEIYAGTVIVRGGGSGVAPKEGQHAGVTPLAEVLSLVVSSNTKTDKIEILTPSNIDFTTTGSLKCPDIYFGSSMVLSTPQQRSNLKLKNLTIDSFASFSNIHAATADILSLQSTSFNSAGSFSVQGGTSVYGAVSLQASTLTLSGSVSVTGPANPSTLVVKTIKSLTPAMLPYIGDSANVNQLEMGDNGVMRVANTLSLQGSVPNLPKNTKLLIVEHSSFSAFPNDKDLYVGGSVTCVGTSNFTTEVTLELLNLSDMIELPIVNSFSVSSGFSLLSPAGYTFKGLDFGGSVSFANTAFYSSPTNTMSVSSGVDVLMLAGSSATITKLGVLNEILIGTKYYMRPDEAYFKDTSHKLTVASLSGDISVTNLTLTGNLSLPSGFDGSKLAPAVTATGSQYPNIKVAALDSLHVTKKLQVTSITSESTSAENTFLVSGFGSSGQGTISVVSPPTVTNLTAQTINSVGNLIYNGLNTTTLKVDDLSNIVSLDLLSCVISVDTLSINKLNVKDSIESDQTTPITIVTSPIKVSVTSFEVMADIVVSQLVTTSTTGIAMTLGDTGEIEGASVKGMKFGGNTLNFADSTVTTGSHSVTGDLTLSKTDISPTNTALPLTNNVACASMNITQTTTCEGFYTSKMTVCDTKCASLQGAAQTVDFLSETINAVSLSSNENV